MKCNTVYISQQEMIALGIKLHVTKNKPPLCENKWHLKINEPCQFIYIAMSSQKLLLDKNLDLTCNLFF